MQTQTAELKEMSNSRFIANFAEMVNTLRGGQYCFVLGAGASISSGIPSGQQLVAEWEEYLQRVEGSNHQNWKDRLGITRENQAEFYSKYYEKRFDDLEHGYAYLEKKMENASPSGGYIALAYLLCRTKNNIVLTTNFDHLTEEAVIQQEGKLPLVAGHEATAPILVNIINRDFGQNYPIIIKIHHDLWMAPKNTPEHTNELDSKWTILLDTVFRRYHPIFIGYAGNDKSLMDYLYDNRKKFQNGVWKMPYWTLYGEAPVRGRVKDFITASGGYVIRNCDFDELLILLGDALSFQLKDENAVIAKAKDEYRRTREKIEAVLTKNRAIDREDEPSNYQKAKEARRRGDYTEAADILRKLIKSQPDKMIYHGELAYALHMMLLKTNIEPESRREQINDEAEEEYRRTLDLDPNNAQNYANFGVFLRYRNKNSEAERIQKKSVELAPQIADFHLNYAATLQFLGKFEEAKREREIAEALQKPPEE